MIGVMLPSATSITLFISRLSPKDKPTYNPAHYFFVGYLFMCLLFSAAITLCQWGLHHAALLFAMMVNNNQYFTGALLMGAGL
ncbi:DUF2182 domain-containing protein [Psychrobium sp. 1_MG-2023]|uniref:copper chaperone n=1 Tax=Psychrobium sp. 1_MG-2023 TaxID=3062624 RepID=UPI00267D28FD|nr:DUF2182 domain-containing protein [Psychrobium sp. 1_MG-2023]MDP2561901.1 DUF2182 domain-containing protein [Psychrobium sp. 1_MG-2023]